MSSSFRPSDSAQARFGVRPLLLLAAFLSVVGVASWKPVPAGVWNDDGAYLVIAKALAEEGRLRYAGVPGDVPAVKFPPGYPMVLGALWSVLPGIGAVTLAAVALNLILLVAGGVLLALALARSRAFQPGGAIGLAGLAYLSPDLWRLGLVPLSEPLFMVLVAGALACWPATSGPEGRRSALILSALLTGAVLTRSAAAAWVLGFAVALALDRGVRMAVAVVAAPAVASLVWGAWAASQIAAIPDGMLDILGPYGGWLGAQLISAPAAFFGGLPSHLGALGRLLALLLLPGLSGPALGIAGVVVAPLVLYGLWLLRQRFPPITWVALSYFAMLVAWPFVDRRLAAPLLPILVVAAGTAIIELWRREARVPAGGTRRAARIMAVGGVVGWVGLYAGVGLWRAHDGWAASPYRIRSEMLAAAVETLRRTAPPDAVVGAPELWAALHLHGGWQAAPSALFLPRSADGVPFWGSPEDQVALWWAARMEYLVLESGGRILGDGLNLMEERCPGAVSIVARMPPQMIVRLRWSDGCVAALGL